MTLAQNYELAFLFNICTCVINPFANVFISFGNKCLLILRVFCVHEFRTTKKALVALFHNFIWPLWV